MKRETRMAGHLSSISVAQQFHQHELFYLTSTLVAHLFDLPRRRVHDLIARLVAARLADVIKSVPFENARASVVAELTRG